MLTPTMRKAIILFLCLCLVLPAWAQLDKLKQKIKIPVKSPAVPDLDKLLQEEPPVSTSLEDAIYDIQFLDAYNPGGGASAVFLPLTPSAGLPLLPGLWEGSFQSYCLHAGTYAPGKGDGYVVAPLKGKQADVVASILKNSVYHPEISQESIQLLLWAVVSRSKLSECSKELQNTARTLLTQKEYDRLNGGAIGKIPQPVLNAALEKLPPLARDILHAEARLREMLVSPVLAPYHEVENVAVRVGEVLPPPDSQEISCGRWNYDPDGYFIRYFPHGYSTTRIQLYYPENFTIETDEKGLITAISDRKGLKISIIYDLDAEPLRYAGDDNVVGIPFKELILSWKGEDGVKTWSIKNTGWVLAGVPLGGGKAESLQNERYPDASERYKFAVNHRDEVLELKNRLGRQIPELRQLSVSSARSLIYLGNYCQALRLAISSATAGKSEQDKMRSAFVGLPYRAWMKGLAILAKEEAEESKDADDVDGLMAGTLNLNEISDEGFKQAAISTVPNFSGSGEFKTCVHDVSGDGHGKGPGDFLMSDQGSPLPDYVWVKKETPGWERETNPQKYGSSGLPLYKPEKKAAQPGNTGKQRLGQSGRKSGSDAGMQSAEKIRDTVKKFSLGTSAGAFVAGKALGTATPYGIPKAVTGYTIGRTVGIWEQCIDAISSDPPRSDYTILARPEPGTFTPVRAEGGLSRARAEAINALMAAAVDLTARLRASRFSVERYSGAMEAGDEEWAKRQLENAIRYARESGLVMMVVADRLEALARVAQSEGVPDFMITREIIEDYRASIREHGFSAEELEACRALKLTSEEIEEMKNEILSDQGVEGPASLYETTRQLVSALRDFAGLLLELPVI